MPIVEEATVELGYRYHSDAVVADEGEDGSLWEDPHGATARPGLRASHIELSADDGAGESTLDLVRRGFVLLAGPAGEPWRVAAEVTAARLGIALVTHVMADTPGFGDRYGIADDGAVLLRPDGFVVWRSATAAEDGAGRLSAALAQILDHSHATGVVVPA